MNTTTTKIFAFLLSATLLLVAACQNASDDTAPRIVEILLDGTAAPLGGNHELGTSLPFQMTLEDNRGLAEFQVQVNGMLDYAEQLEGESASINYNFEINADTHMVEDSIYLIFIAEDEFGNVGFQSYSMLVVE